MKCFFDPYDVIKIFFSYEIIFFIQRINLPRIKAVSSILLEKFNFLEKLSYVTRVTSFLIPMTSSTNLILPGICLS